MRYTDPSAAFLRSPHDTVSDMNVNHSGANFCNILSWRGVEKKMPILVLCFADLRHAFGFPAHIAAGKADHFFETHHLQHGSSHC